MMRRALAAVAAIGILVFAATAFAAEGGEKKTLGEKQIPGITLDIKNKRVELAGRISLRQGILELFACGKKTKEHESIVVLDAKPSQVAYALSVVGLEPGLPGSWTKSGVYRPPSGPVFQILVKYKSKKGKLVIDGAESWILNSVTKEPLSEKLTWVYCCPGTAEALRAADGHGTAITLSNFPSAVLDLPFESSDVNANVLYEANPKTVPPIGTAVTLVLVSTGKRIAAKKVELALVLKKGKPTLLDGKAMELEELSKAIEKTDVSITAASLKAEAGVPFGRVMAIMEILRKGYFRVHMALLKPGDEANAGSLKVRVHADGKVSVNGARQTLEEFQKGVGKLARLAKVAAIVPDAEAPKGLVSKVVEALQSAGIDSQIAPSSEKRPGK